MVGSGEGAKRRTGRGKKKRGEHPACFKGVASDLRQCRVYVYRLVHM